MPSYNLKLKFNNRDKLQMTHLKMITCFERMILLLTFVQLFVLSADVVI